MRIEAFYEKLWVEEGLPWCVQVKDEKGNLLAKHKASAVHWEGPCETVFLPDNPGGKRGYILSRGELSFVGTAAHIRARAS